ncbi:hypothetical protein Poli38472_000346 [Pythium oligandrum]|uniref:C-CAP/cofactor C-like domain-containing protein n=1 Tax=Pythium oligandrum TaxID=41045 RepID=A0A8K1CC43_PYTOL|nr:hypothetical protein Poli38472_000346 [Pythium oligandrum]|eukprot:TMW60304.1 hypothetical protein Poli38472_000346 [Pythium oligandrum]
MVTACHNCKIVMAPSSGIFCVDRCENMRISAIAGLMRVSNCLDSVISTYTPVPLIMSGENVGVQLGPYNSKYPGLKEQFAKAQIAYNAEFVGCWDSFLNLEDESDQTEREKAPISMQAPATFREICVPVKIKGQGPAERPFPLPPAFVETLRAQQETVETLRRLVTSDEFDLSTKRNMEIVIQMRFKEWLSTTGNVRQILDLVNIEKARNSTSAASTPLGDRTPSS